MGTYVEGSFEATFSRELTEDEYRTWAATCEAGRPGLGECQHHHLPLYHMPAGVRCARFGTPEPRSGYCYGDSERYDANGWTFDDSTWGDVGIAELADTGFTINSGGKVYDIEDAARFWVESLPADVGVVGEGFFDSDGWEWTLCADGREVWVEDTVKFAASKVPPEPKLRTLVFALGPNLASNQALVTIYPNGRVDLATRAYSGDVWGVPWTLIEEA